LGQIKDQKSLELLKKSRIKKITSRTFIIAGALIVSKGFFKLVFFIKYVRRHSTKANNPLDDKAYIYRKQFDLKVVEQHLEHFSHL